MSSFDASEPRRSERRWVIIGVVAVGAVLAAQVAAGLVGKAVSDEPSHLERVQTCLAERNTPFKEAVDDFIAVSAARGALRTEVGGNPVTVALGESEKDAERIFGDYSAVMSADAVKALLDRRRKVVFLWEREPTASQREFMYLCALDAQD